MITEKVNEAVNYIQKLSRKEFNKYLITTLACVAVLSLAMTYYIYSKSSALVEEIKKLNVQSRTVEKIFAQNKVLQNEEEMIKKLLKKDPNFNMRSFFEKFYTKHKIKPEPNWKPEDGDIIPGTELGVKYQEVILRATFKGQTMQKLVTLLKEIYKDPIIYLKAIEINGEKNKINFELTLATKRYKKEEEG
jgi:hypothetical protein